MSIHPNVWSRPLLFCILLISSNSWGQGMHRLEGGVQDSSQTNLMGATVVLLSLPDTNLHSYALSNESGAFVLKTIPTGDYLLEVNYLGYTSYQCPLALNKDSLLGKIQLATANNELSTVEVQASYIPVQMRGDTLAFNAAAFDTKKHGTVQDLVRQLPGLVISPDGTMTLNGKPITQLLIDGKTVDGLAMQELLTNLPAEAIKRIEFVQQEEEAQASRGAKDAMVMDLKLKQKAKNKWLGYLTAGYGSLLPPRMIQNRLNPSNHLYLGALKLNQFSSKWRVILNGNIDNHYTKSSFADNFGKTPARGFPQNRGLNAFISWEASKKLSFNYIGGWSNFDNLEESIQRLEMLLPNNSYRQNSLVRNRSQGTLLSQGLGMNWKIDSFQTLKVNGHVLYRTSDKNIERTTTTRNENQLNNDLEQVQVNNGESLDANATIKYIKRFRKSKRKLTVDLKGDWHVNDVGQDNQSTTLFYEDTVLVENLRQEQYNWTHRQSGQLKVVYQEPISKKSALHFTSTTLVQAQENRQQVFEGLGENKLLDASLSAAFWRSQQTQTFSTKFKYRAKNYDFSLDAALEYNHIAGDSLRGQNPIEQTTLLPNFRVDWTYYFTKKTKATLSYHSHVDVPELTDLQPLVNNNDPLLLVLGNANLNPAYWHTFFARVDWRSKDLKHQVYMNFSGSLTQNSFVSSQSIDESFRRTIQTVNADALQSTLNAMLGFNSLIPIVNWYARGSISFYRMCRPLIINEVASIQENQTYRAKLTLSNQKTKKVEVRLMGDFRYDRSINERTTSRYFNHIYATYLRWNILERWEVESQFALEVYNPTNFSSSVVIPNWRAGTSYFFLKNEALKLSFLVENIMDNGNDIRRRVEVEQISEQETLRLGRYFLLSLSYKLGVKK